MGNKVNKHYRKFKTRGRPRKAKFKKCDNQKHGETKSDCKQMESNPEGVELSFERKELICIRLIPSPDGKNYSFERTDGVSMKSEATPLINIKPNEANHQQTESSREQIEILSDNQKNGETKSDCEQMESNPEPIDASPAVTSSSLEQRKLRSNKVSSEKLESNAQQTEASPAVTYSSLEQRKLRSNKVSSEKLESNTQQTKASSTVTYSSFEQRKLRSNKVSSEKLESNAQQTEAIPGQSETSPKGVESSFQRKELICIRLIPSPDGKNYSLERTDGASMKSEATPLINIEPNVIDASFERKEANLQQTESSREQIEIKSNESNTERNDIRLEKTTNAQELKKHRKNKKKANKKRKKDKLQQNKTDEQTSKKCHEKKEPSNIKENNTGNIERREDARTTTETRAEKQSVHRRNKKLNNECTLNTLLEKDNSDEISGKMTELEKFKRRLIRTVARLQKENVSEDELWEQLQKSTSCDCQWLWNRMKTLTIKRLNRLLIALDRPESITAVARMTLTDWMMFDFVLVHEKMDLTGVNLNWKSEPLSMFELFLLVQRFGIEGLQGDELATAWTAATVYYNSSGRQCSPMLLQRRWYQIKELTRLAFYKFWFHYRGHVKKLDSARELYSPSKLQKAVAKRYPHIITTPFIPWEELIEKRLAILPEEFQQKMRDLKNASELPEPCNTDSPDVLIVEPEIEVIDLRLDSDSEKEFDDLELVIEAEKIMAASNNSEVGDLNSTTANNLKASDATTTETNIAVPSTSRVVKTESIDVDIEELDHEILATSYMEKQYTNTAHKESNDQDGDVSICNEQLAKKLPTNVDLAEDPNNANDDNCSNDQHVNSKNNIADDYPIDDLDNVKGKNYSDKQDISGITEKVTAKIKIESHPMSDSDKQDISGITEQVAVKIKREDHPINDLYNTDVENCTDDQDVSEVNKQHYEGYPSDEPLNINCETTKSNIKNEKVPIAPTISEPIVMPLITNVFGNVYVENEVLAKIGNVVSANTAEIASKKDVPVKVSVYNEFEHEKTTEMIDIADDDDEDIIKCEPSENVDNVHLNMGQEVNQFNDVSFVNNGIEFVDDGIALSDDSENHNPHTYQSGNDEENPPFFHKSIKESMEHNSNKSDDLKFDLKLLMVSVVYTTKLDDMIYFKNKSYDHVKLDKNLNNIIKESKPVKKNTIENSLIENIVPPVSDPEDKDMSDDLFDNNSVFSYNSVESNGENEIPEKFKVKTSSSLLQKPRMRTYNPIILCKNPDFNTRLKRLTVGFLSSMRNRQLLKLCKPMTIDVSKVFESKLIDGTLYLKSGSPLDNNEQMDIGVNQSNNLSEQSASVVPSAMLAQSLLDNIKVNDCSLLLQPNKHTNKKIYDEQINSYQQDVSERKKAINLPDIDIIRRNNQRLLTAEVTPMRIGINVDEEARPPVQIVPQISTNCPSNLYIGSSKNSNQDDPMKKNLNRLHDTHINLKNTDIVPIENAQNNNPLASNNLMRIGINVDKEARPPVQIVPQISTNCPSNLYIGSSENSNQDDPMKEKNNHLDRPRRRYRRRLQNVDMDLMKKPFTRPCWRPKLAPSVNWFTKNAPIKDNDVLLTLDTLNKMFYLISPEEENEKPSIGQKVKKLRKLQKNVDEYKNKINSKSDNKQNVKNDDQALKDGSQQECGRKLVTDKKVPKVNIIHANSKVIYDHCCWASYKIDNVNTTKKHKCLLNECTCCCKKLLEEFQKGYIVLSDEDNPKSNNNSETIENVIQKPLVTRNDSEKNKIDNVDDIEIKTKSNKNYDIPTLKPIRVKKVTNPDTVLKLSNIMSTDSETKETVNINIENNEISSKSTENMKNCALTSLLLNKVKPIALLKLSNVNADNVVNPVPVEQNLSSHKSSKAILQSDIIEIDDDNLEELEHPEKNHSNNNMHLVFNNSKSIFTNQQLLYTPTPNVTKNVLFFNSKQVESPIFLGNNSILLTNVRLPEKNVHPFNVRTEENKKSESSNVHIAYGDKYEDLAKEKEKISSETITISPDQPNDSINMNNEKVTTTENVEENSNTEDNHLVIKNNESNCVAIPKDSTNEEGEQSVTSNKTGNCVIDKKNISEILNREQDKINTEKDSTTSHTTLTENIASIPITETNLTNSTVLEQLQVSSQLNVTVTKSTETNIATENIANDKRKNILSDLMEMSGISEEVATSIAPNNDTCNNVPLPSTSKNTVLPEIPPNNSDIAGTSVIFELYVVSSFKELSYAYDNGGKFYKYDLTTNNILEINVSIKKNTKSKKESLFKPSSSLLVDQKTQIIDLTNDKTSPQEPKVLILSDEMKTNIKKQNSDQLHLKKTKQKKTKETKATSIAKPLKLFRAIPKVGIYATKLYTKLPNFFNKTLQKKPDNVEEAPSETLVRTQKIRKRKQSFTTKSSTNPVTEIVLTDSPNDSYDNSSDDEPLAKKFKRLRQATSISDIGDHNNAVTDYDDKNTTDSVNPSNQDLVDDESNEILDADMAPISELSFISDIDMSQEDCILGV